MRVLMIATLAFVAIVASTTAYPHKTAALREELPNNPNINIERPTEEFLATEHYIRQEHCGKFPYNYHGMVGAKRECESCCPSPRRCQTYTDQGKVLGYECREESRGCFPSDATVQTPAGSRKMHELKVGDCVQSVGPDGSINECDTIYMFGHADHTSKSTFQQLQLASGQTLHLSGKHFIPTGSSADTDFASAQLKHAKDVTTGEFIWDTTGISQVINTTTAVKQGLFNPYTHTGYIVVDKVVASAHSEWFLDDSVPTSLLHYLPQFYQAALAPNRFLNTACGPAAADFLGLGNPASHAQFWIDFFAHVATSITFAALALPMLYRWMS